MAVADEKYKGVKPKLSIWIKLLVLAVALGCSVFFVVIAKRWSNGGFTPVDSSLRAQGVGQGDILQFNWPEKRIKFNMSFTNREPREHIYPAVNFRIPKEYLDAGGTYLDKNKEIEELSIGFELPGAAPFQHHPELKLDRDSPEYAKFKEKWLGRFFLRLKRDSFYSPESAMLKFKGSTSAGLVVSDGYLAGLIRYSSQTCLSENRVDHPDAVKFVAGKDSDDNSRAGCRINRRSMELISAPGGDIDDFAEATCTGTSCHLRFVIVGRAAIVSVRPEDLTSWRVITSSARALVHGFIMPEGSLQAEENSIYAQ